MKYNYKEERLFRATALENILLQHKQHALYRKNTNWNAGVCFSNKSFNPWNNKVGITYHPDSFIAIGVTGTRGKISILAEDTWWYTAPGSPRSDSGPCPHALPGSGLFHPVAPYFAWQGCKQLHAPWAVIGLPNHSLQPLPRTTRQNTTWNISPMALTQIFQHTGYLKFPISIESQSPLPLLTGFSLGLSLASSLL